MRLRYLLLQVRVFTVHVLLLLSCMCLSRLQLHMNAIASLSGELPLSL